MSGGGGDRDDRDDRGDVRGDRGDGRGDRGELPAPPSTPEERAALWRPIRLALAELAAADPRHKRFGAAAHRYRLRPPLSEARLAELEAGAGVHLPADYRDFLLELGDGGAGPYFGLAPLDQPAQLAQLGGAFAPPAGAGGQAPWRGTALLSHLGCGYLAHLVVDDGPHRGEVWLDLGSVAPPARIAPHFIAFYTAWIKALHLAEWPPEHVPPGRCALAQALSGYLGHVEQRLGKPAGSLDEAELRAAFAALGPGAIQIVAETRSYPPVAAAEPLVDPCLSCERMLLSLADQGLARQVVSPGAAVGFPDSASIS